MGLRSHSSHALTRLLTSVFRSTATRDDKIGLICINTPLPQKQLESLWDVCQLRVACDGAANRLRPLQKTPDVIIGDFDSITQQTLEFYRDEGVEIVDLHEDKNSTDLEKAGRLCRRRGVDGLVIFGEFSGSEGRLDHTFGIINYLCKLERDKIPAAVIGRESYMCVLSVGKHELPVTSSDSSARCAVVPISGPTKIATEGLYWNFDGESQFSGLVSTSNKLDPHGNDKVIISCSEVTLWICGLPPSVRL
eukprot:GEMP01075972.1.p1 GENE.GEMP01075972.1~~GEMP01075972.1.p1  ORF type:complete len:250 (+),score=34.26 GEMP01075972.1:27-776(+)